MRTCPVIVIGHVDHGKTSLVRALTGIETDRLPEEKARGLSIVPGFAFRAFEDVIVDFIDAPGHADFVRAMISGASGARAALLVISAAEGVRAQTREYIDIADALGIKASIVAITMADRISGDEHTACEAKLRNDIAGTRFSDAPVMFCSSVTGAGIDELGKALNQLGREAAGTEGPQAAFLPLDRVFTADGHGTIVTGTLLGAPLSRGDAVVLAPSGKTVTVRRIEVRGQDVPMARPGERTALNLRGVSADQVRPGHILHAPDAFAATLVCDVAIHLSGRAGRPLKHMQSLAVHYGSGHATASLRLLDDGTVDPGTERLASLAFASPVCLFAGQRIILRSLSPSETLGGATVLDPVSPPVKAGKRLRWATLNAALRGDISTTASALAEENAGIADIKDICRLTRAPAARVRDELAAGFLQISNDTFAPKIILERVESRYLAVLSAYHLAHPLKPASPFAELADRKTAPELMTAALSKLVAEHKLVRFASGAALATHAPESYLTPLQRDRLERIVDALKAAGLTPPPRNALIAEPADDDLLEILVHSGRVLKLMNVSLKQTLFLHADAIEAAADMLRSRYPGRAAFTTGEARAALETSRKCIVPLLEFFDETGVTVRDGDMRFIA